MKKSVFACFGLKSRQKRHPKSIRPEIEIVENGSAFDRTLSLGRTPLLHKNQQPQIITPYGTPLPRRGSFRRKKRRTSESEGAEKHPVKILRPTAPNGQTPSPLPSQISEQLKKLEAEISARTQEAQKSREEVTKANGGLEALTVLVHYLTNEYDAFSTPKLRAEIESLTSQLTDVRLCLSSAAARRLEIEAAEQCQKHEEVVNNLKEAHRQEVSSITLEHQRKLDEERIINNCSQRAIGKNRNTMERGTSISNINLRSSEEAWKLREQELQESNAKLLKEQNNLKQQAKKLEETLLSDKDHRLQAAKRVCGALQNEVDSLKTVVDMRNSEVHKLRDQLADKERICEELDSARDRVRALQAKAEDLHAQMETKLQLERQLLTDRHSLTESLQREASVNKRLSLENEELQWKLRQRDSTPNSSHTIGTKPHDKKWSQSFSNIPEDAGKLLRRTELHHGNVMIESPPPSPRVKAVIEKSNSVSFILDLNDTYPNEHLIGAQSYHQLRKSSTSNLQRKPFTKSYSSNLEKSKSTSLVQGSSKTFDVNKSSREKLNKKENVNGECDSDVYKNENGKHSKYDRTCSTSESSDSGEIERISPTGLSWTVPVHSKRYSKHIPSNRFQLVPETPRLLQQPDEDEYEEAENENEFVEVLALGEDISSAPLTMLFAQTPSTSVSLSDSDVSQCGSRADITSDDDDDDD
ncbi:Microtubule-associated tumor suppressor 1-like protein, partial [Armadillidium nasatum]